MANLNVEELLREVNADGATRDEFYGYLRANNPTVKNRQSEIGGILLLSVVCRRFLSTLRIPPFHSLEVSGILTFQRHTRRV